MGSSKKVLSRYTYSEEELIEEEIRNSRRNGSKEPVHMLPTHRCIVSYRYSWDSDNDYITACYGNNNEARCVECQCKYLTVLGRR
jgi:hypothetical protein